MTAYLTRSQFERLDRGAKNLEPDQYFQKWIPKFYGLQKGEHGYRKACITEIRKHFPYIAAATIDKNWGTDFEKRPEYIPFALQAIDKLHAIREFVNQNTM